MPDVIVMPKLGLSMVEGTLVEWLVSEGDQVQEGDLICEVDVEKMSTNVEAPATGTVGALLVAPGEVVPVNGPIAVLVAPGEEVDIGEYVQTYQLRRELLPAGFDKKLTKIGDRFQIEGENPRGRDSGGPTPREVPVFGSERVSRRAMSPLARRRARELGIDPSTMTGTGTGGRITRSDVDSSLQSHPVPKEPLTSSDPAFATSRKRPTRRPLDRTRKRIADNLSATISRTVHATLSVMADATELVQLRSRLAGDITYTDILVLFLGRALVGATLLRSVVAGDELVTFEDIDIGIAVHLEDKGLVVPVLRDADVKTVQEIATDRKHLVTGAREGTLGVDEYAGACFTLSNIGSVDRLDHATPVISGLQSAILGTGSISERVIAREGLAVVAPTLPLFLSIDHRVIDGEPALRFLGKIRELVEDPAAGLISN